MLCRAVLLPHRAASQGLLPSLWALARNGSMSDTLAASASTQQVASYQTPPPDASRMGTADLTDKFMPDPVDATVSRKVQVVTPNLFK